MESTHGEELAMSVDRSTLYEQVWTTPMSRLCKTYGLSDVGLAKICDQHRIPCPPRGYWAKKRSGKTVRRRPLPALTDDRMEKVCLQARPVEEAVGDYTEADRIVAREKEEGPRIEVAATLVDAHPLVVRTVKSLLAARPDERGLVRPGAKGCLDVTVGMRSTDRAMRVLDALIRALEVRSFRVVLGAGEGEQAGTWAELHGERVRFRLDERVTRTERPQDKKKPDEMRWFFRDRIEYDFSPSGELALHLVHSGKTILRHSWRDGGKRRLEGWLNSFVVGLVRVALGLEDERREAERQRLDVEQRRRAREEAELLRREEERLARDEEERVRGLEAALDSWVRLQHLLAMIEEAKVRAGRMGRGISPGSRLGRWLELAERRAAGLDPFRDMIAEIEASTGPHEPEGTVAT